MSELKAAFSIFTDRQRREELIKIIKANPVGGLMIAIISGIIPTAITVVLNLTFESQRDWAVMGFFIFIIIIATIVLLYTMNKSAYKHKIILDDDRLENEKLSRISSKEETEKKKIEAAKEVNLKKIAIDERKIEKEVTALEHQKEIDEFAAKTFQEQKKYQLYLLANQSHGYYEELVSIVSNIIFLADTIKGEDDLVTKQLIQYTNRMHTLIDNIGQLPELVEKTYKEFIRFNKGVDLDNDGEYETFVEEIRGISNKLRGKVPIQTEKKPPKPTSDKSDANELEDSLKELNTEMKDELDESVIFNTTDDQDDVDNVEENDDTDKSDRPPTPQ